MGFKIKEIVAICSVDEKDGDEGVWSFGTPGGTHFPMVAADETRLQQLLPIAIKMSIFSGKQFKVLRFTNREDITEETKNKYTANTKVHIKK